MKDPSTLAMHFPKFSVSSAFVALFATFLVSPVFAYPNPGLVTGDYSGVHDPSKLCKDSSGKYWLFSTG